ncbi:Tad domain-containing protein [Arthrobacter sp. H20]|uniref:Tad domain-containing protein n=1 Tax=Arthrobacter sp. H20 TaxID=1267981 RepID=UPI00047A3909|nr:Tad domain-containing protein [Arthrobacter sp. H20]
MRRVNIREDSERGAISIIAAVLMVVLLGFTALAVDVGLLYAEKAQLQNGADAAALGVAQACADVPVTTDCSASSPLAASLADSNALDGFSNVPPLLLDLAARKVTVVTGAQEASGENHVSLFFANALGIPTAEVGAQAKARWGTPIGGPTVFPATFSICQVQGRVDGSLQRLGLHGGSYANSSCNYGPSGAPVAGGFGWLAQDPGQCGGRIDVLTNEGGSATGNNEPPNCTAVFQKWISEINAGRKPTVLLPVFNVVSGTGSGAVYGIKTFAAFEVKGWKFTGGSESPSNPATFHNTSAHVGGMECRGNCRGIIGTFVTYVSLAEGYELGPLDEYGARVVEMTD